MVFTKFNLKIRLSRLSDLGVSRAETFPARGELPASATSYLRMKLPAELSYGRIFEK